MSIFAQRPPRLPLEYLLAKNSLPRLLHLNLAHFFPHYMPTLRHRQHLGMHFIAELAHAHDSLNQTGKPGRIDRYTG